MAQLLSCIYNIISLRLYEHYFSHTLPSLAEYYLQVTHHKLMHVLFSHAFLVSTSLTGFYSVTLAITCNINFENPHYVIFTIILLFSA